MLVVSVFVVQIVNAVPAAPSPTCEVTANVLKIEKTRTNIEGLGQPPRKDFDYYKVSLDFLEITTYKEEGISSCDNSYLDEQSLPILSLAEYNKNPISEGQKIKAKIHFDGDEWFNGYFLSDTLILEDITTEKDKTTTELNYRYYIILGVIILFIIFYILLKRKKK